MDSQVVISFLSQNDIEYSLIHHPPVYTVAEAKEHRQGMDEATHAKNLFLKDGKRKKFYLLSAEAENTTKLGEIRKIIGAKKLSFASADDLKDILSLEPGSVSPFGLLNDNEDQVHYLVDQTLWEAEYVAFHPNVNTQTLVISGPDFQRVIEMMGYKPTILDIS